MLRSWSRPSTCSAGLSAVAPCAEDDPRLPCHAIVYLEPYLIPLIPIFKSLSVPQGGSYFVMCPTTTISGHQASNCSHRISRPYKETMRDHLFHRKLLKWKFLQSLLGALGVQNSEVHKHDIARVLQLPFSLTSPLINWIINITNTPPLRYREVWWLHQSLSLT